ncbi:PRAME family member 12-like [Mesocricetus auratus]|uniref:PRAME family member 12-like n=1 Tax=Mesocricetus auratus TaxID=10036 RepID=A0A3Q0DBB2_MESAU|nr:PRAME family member 12-like [Mesocricetus auratus]
MSIRTPPTLEELARNVLLRNETLAISALEDLPMMLFPALFKEAFSGRHTKIVKAMVAAWPFPCLPLGTLMNTFNLEIFQAVLDGLDVLLTQQVCPKRGKLQVLDFRQVHHEFWSIQVGTKDGDCSAETVSEKQVVQVLPRDELRRQLKVIADLYFRFHLDEEETYLLHWAQQRKDSLQLCCVNMKIVLLSLDNVRMVLTVFKPEHMEVLELTIDWSWCTLARFSSCLTQMRHLHTLSLVWIHKNGFGILYIPGLEKFIQKFIAQFSRLSSLQHLYLNGFCFLSDHMKLLLRNLKATLETFSVTHSHFLQPHLQHFSQCQRLHQLKHLDMSGVPMSHLFMMPLRVLLENVSDTLETLQLQGCEIKDSQLNILLPALSQCSQLTKVNFYTNDFSMNILSDLLLHTANMSKMTMEQYPAPLECYDELGYVSIERFVQLCPLLIDTLRAIRQPKMISFATDVCSRCFKRCVYDQEPRLCPCLQ